MNEVELTIRAFRAVLGTVGATYVAIPMTSGKRYLDWAERTGIRDREGAEVWSRIFNEVVKPNIDDARPFVDSLRKRWDSPIVDPTELEFLEGWQQIDFYELWKRVFDEFIHSVILFSGWEYSVGCCKEVARALELRLPLMDVNLKPLRKDDIESQMFAGISETTERGFPTDLLQDCLERVKKLKSHGSN